MPQDLTVILHNEKRGLLTIEDERLDVLQLSRNGRPPKRLLSCPIRNVLRTKLGQPIPGQPTRLDIHVLIQNGTGPMRLSKMHVLVEPINQPEAEEWVDLVMDTAYRGAKPFRKVLLLVNPVGGKGKAKSIVKNDVMPLLDAAGCTVEIIETTHRLHAQEIVASINLEYDVIATASGDGTVFEVFNGLANRPDARRALKTPVAPIPTGSANSLCINILGPKDTFNIELACLNVIKGQSTPKDLCSVLQSPSNERVWSFLALATGLMVDLDIGTEHLRWMGDARFTLGFIKGVTVSKNHKCRIRMRVLAEDKIEMARGARGWAKSIMNEKPVGGGIDPLTNGVKKVSMAEGANGDVGTLPKKESVNKESASGGAVDGSNTESSSTPAIEKQNIDQQAHGISVEESGPMPEHKHMEPDETWQTIETGIETSKPRDQRNIKVDKTGQTAGWIDGEGVLYAYAGNMPWIARDLMQWPVSVQGSGAFDLVVQSIAPRTTVLSAITGAAKGEQFWMDCQHYYKVDRMIVENLDKEKQKIWAIDGESYPYDSFSVELHSGAARILTLDGHLFIPEFLKKHTPM